jgi:DNA-binding CsgD family transcriptional regulator
MASADVILGRDTELHEIRDFVHASAKRALLVRGEPGIGKTTLWRASILLAAKRGYQTISTRPSESEAKFSYMGLGDLLEHVPDDVLDDLPGPQRLALQVALLREEAPAMGLDHRTVCVAVLATLRAVASSAPILVAIDDVQWLDGPTAFVVEFVARRLTHEPIRFVAAIRATPGIASPVDFASTLGEDQVRTVNLSGLSVDSLGALLSERLDTRFPRPTLNRIFETSGGNPFYALELARALVAGRVQLQPGRLVSVPPDLAELVPARLAGLPASSQELLLMCAASSAPTMVLLRSASDEPQRVSSQLANAINAGVIEVYGERIRFTHPLLSSAVYSEATEDQRHKVHRRLAGVVEDSEEHAWHVALASDSPSSDVAVELEEAAEFARRRGAPGAAADLCVLAADLTPSDDAPRARRLRLRAADFLIFGGDVERALEIAKSVASAAPQGPERAEALLRKGIVLFWLEDYTGAAAQLGEASVQPDVPSTRLSTIHSWLSASFAWQDLPLSERHAEEAVYLARGSGDRTGLALAVGALIAARTRLGAIVPDTLLTEAMELESAVVPFFVGDRPRMVLAIRMLYASRLDEARRTLVDLIDEALLIGDEISLGDLYEMLASLELLTGNWRAAVGYCDRLAAVSPPPSQSLIRARVDAHLGETAAATAAAETALQSARDDDLDTQIQAFSVLGFVELSQANAIAAGRHLGRAWEIAQRWGTGEPARSNFVADYAESLIELGQLEGAAAILAWLEERGRTLGRPWALAAAARYRGSLTAAQGKIHEAVQLMDDAVAQHQSLPMPFELGRTLLLQGTIRRRAKQKRSAREALGQSLEIFDLLGATLWATRARAELARVSGRRPEAGQLTPVERRVALLAAAGRTNQEIAKSLFMSTRTVGSHLSHVYAKLGIRSRTELGLFADLLEESPAHS